MTPTCRACPPARNAKYTNIRNVFSLKQPRLLHIIQLKKRKSNVSQQGKTLQEKQTAHADLRRILANKVLYGSRTICMQTIPLNNWTEFQEKLKFPSDVQKVEDALSTGLPYGVYFRGQANGQWTLETTLHRLEDEIHYDFTFADYLRKALGICGAVDTYTGWNWNLDSGDISNLNTGDILAELTGGDLSSHKTRKRIIEYLIFLRHCGFPSPLLDWSESPYVAAFFAFAEIPKNAESVAIYQFQETPCGLKHVENDNEAKIRTIPYDLNTHKRHYLQQTKYTICTKYFGVTQGFGEYEEAVSASEQLNCYDGGKHRQDSLVKYTIPSLERKKALRQLDKMNITYVSLFETEDALIRTLALREMELWKD